MLMIDQLIKLNSKISFLSVFYCILSILLFFLSIYPSIYLSRPQGGQDIMLMIDQLLKLNLNISFLSVFYWILSNLLSSIHLYVYSSSIYLGPNFSRRTKYNVNDRSTSKTQFKFILYIYLSIRFSIHLLIFLFIHLSFYPLSFFLSIYPSFYPFICFLLHSIYPSFLSIYPIYLSIYTSIHILSRPQGGQKIMSMIG